jgi:hypothetical protein
MIRKSRAIIKKDPVSTSPAAMLLFSMIWASAKVILLLH